MDWGNAIVRTKTTDASGKIASITMDLHLEGDFRKTKKKITWLSGPADTLVESTLLDYDYLITKKKLEEDDDVKDFVTPVSEFREDALADANVKELKKGDIIQFERKGYYIFDGIAANGRYEFIHIPDGRAASIASKAGVLPEASKAASKEESSTLKVSDTPVETKMYKVAKVYGEAEVLPKADTKMYQVKNIHLQ
jgi:glutamyl-tRNA synthetase